MLCLQAERSVAAVVSLTPVSPPEPGTGAYVLHEALRPSHARQLIWNRRRTASANRKASTMASKLCTIESARTPSAAKSSCASNRAPSEPSRRPSAESADNGRKVLVSENSSACAVWPISRGSATMFSA